MSWNDWFSEKESLILDNFSYEWIQVLGENKFNGKSFFIIPVVSKTDYPRCTKDAVEASPPAENHTNFRTDIRFYSKGPSILFYPYFLSILSWFYLFPDKIWIELG